MRIVGSRYLHWSGSTLHFGRRKLACILAMSPSVTRSPAAIRKLGDDIVKRLRRKVAVAEQSPDLKDFVRRSFWGNDEGGQA